MNSAARVISNTRKFGSRLSRLHAELHWLDVTDRVRLKLAVLMYRCLRGTAPPYLMDSCTLTAGVTGRQRLRSATRRKLTVPRYRLNGIRDVFKALYKCSLYFLTYLPDITWCEVSIVFAL